MQDLTLSFRASPQQSRLWRLGACSTLSPYSVSRSVTIAGSVDEDKVRSAIASTIERHEILRTSLEQGPDRAVPLQALRSTSDFVFRSEDLANLSEQDKAARLDWTSVDLFPRPTYPPLQVTLSKLSNRESLLSLQLPAANGDEESLCIVAADIFAFYRHGRLTDEQRPQYVDYTDYRLQLLEDNEAGRRYWRRQLLAATPLAINSYSPISPASREFKPRCAVEPLTDSSMFGLIRLAKECGVDPSNIFLACWLALLWRRTQAPKFLLGYSCTGRDHQELIGAVGPFETFVPIACELNERQTFCDVVSHASIAAQGATQFQSAFEWSQHAGVGSTQHEYLPIAFRFSDRSQIHRDESFSAVFSSARAITDRFGLQLVIGRLSNSFITELWYDGNQHDHEDAASLLRQYQHLVYDVLSRPNVGIRYLNILDGAERELLLRNFSGSGDSSLPPQTLQDCLRTHATRQPDAVALIDAQQHLTYGECDRLTAEFVGYLLSLGVGPEVRVAVMLNRTASLVIAVVGILRAGGAYVPIDPLCPAERIAFILNDSGSKILVTERALSSQIPPTEATVIHVDDDLRVSTSSNVNLEDRIDSANIAYVIYTSGSTGTPKGVMITRAGLANYLSWCISEYKVADGGGSAVHSSIGFDLTVTSLFPPLLAGKPVVLMDQTTGIEMIGAPNSRRGQPFSLLKVTPAHLDVLRTFIPGSDLPKLTKAIVIGGESLRWSMLSFLRESKCAVRIFNEYGPTETVVGCCVYEVSDCLAAEREVPIGRPIVNTRSYVLDGNGYPTPIGVTGELCIGGVGLARGYGNKPGLTAEKFVPDGFSEEVGARMYRTGDLACWREDGNLEFLGRLDQQVKIRGYRVELGEIEAALSSHEGVRQSAVMAREDRGGNKRLVGYIVARQKPGPDSSELREWLKEKLPDYMIPAVIVTLEQMPLTENGKLDRRALPEPARRVVGEEGPSTAAERILSEIWKQLLGLERVGVRDNFFELGGDSILSLQVVARAQEAGLRLTARQLFQHQTIRELAALAESGGKVVAEQQAEQGAAPLTPIQRWFLERELNAPHYYTQSVLLRPQRVLAASVVERAVQKLVEHHEAWRFRFRVEGKEWQQQAAETEEHRIFGEVNVSELGPEEARRALQQAGSRLQASLDLASGPVMRASWWQMGQMGCRLLLTAHHLTVDGVSWRILLEDLQTACEQLGREEEVKLPARRGSFTRWARALERHAGSEEVESEWSYWLEQGAQGRGLPRDVAGENTMGSTAAVVVEMEPAVTTELLQVVPRAGWLRVDEVLLAAVVTALTEWTGASPILLDVEGHGREEIPQAGEIARVVGWFTSLYPVLLQRAPEGDMGRQLARVREQMRGIPQRGMGYGILRYLSGRGELAAQLRARMSPEVSFNYLGQFDQVIGEQALFRPAVEAIGPSQDPREKRSYVLEIGGQISSGRLVMNWNYSRNLHRPETIEAIARRFQKTLHELIAYCHSHQSVPSPRDFPLAKIGQEQLAEVLRRSQLN